MESTSPVICQEIFDENSQPSAEEITDYAQQIGIDPISESHLLPLAKDGLMQALPDPWKAFYDEKLKSHYYYNPVTKQTQWEHPVDKVYKELVAQARTASEKDNSAYDDTCASIQEIATSDEVSKYQDKSRDDSIKTDNTYTNKSKQFRDEGRPLMLQQRLNDMKLHNLGHSIDSMQKQNQRYPVSFGKPPLAPIHKLTKQQSEIIDLNIGILSDTNVHNTSRVTRSDMRGAEHQGLPLSGKGSMFLKTRHSETSLLDGIMISSINQKEDNRRGILRESEKITKEHVLEAHDDDKKSVRFNLKTPDDLSNTQSSENSSTEQKIEVPTKKDSTPNILINEGLQPSAKNLQNIKLTPISLKSETRNDEIAENTPTKKRLLKPPVVGFIKPDLFQKKFDKISDIINPISGDSDSESELKPRPRSPLNPPKAKLSINLMESIESETSSESNNDDDRNKSKQAVKKTSHGDKKADDQENLEARKNRGKYYNEKLQELKNCMQNDFEKKKKHLSQEFRIKSFNLEKEMITFHTQTDNEKLSKLKSELQIEFENREKTLREVMKLKLVDLENEITLEHKNETDKLRERLDQVQLVNKGEIEQAIQNLKSQHTNTLESTVRTLSDQLESEKDETIARERERMRKELEMKILEIQNENRSLLEKLESDFCERFKKTEKRLEQEEEVKLRDLRETLTQKFESEKQNLSAEHSRALEMMRRDHERLCEEIRHDYRKEVNVLRSEQCAHVEELRSKRRNEQKALLDKYKCLKEKYIKLKTDVKLSIERRNKKRELSLTTGSETDKSNSHRMQHAQRCKQLEEQLNETFNGETILVNNVGEASTSLKVVRNDRKLDKSPVRRFLAKETEGRKNFSDNENNLDTSLSASESRTASKHAAKTKTIRSDAQKPPTKPRSSTREKALTDYHDSSDGAESYRNKDKETGKTRKKSFAKARSASTSKLNNATFANERCCSPVENLRLQLRKLEELEDQFPDVSLESSAYKLRYPFGEKGRGTELEFMAHRALVEKERLRRARHNLSKRAKHLRDARLQQTHNEDMSTSDLSSGDSDAIGRESDINERLHAHTNNELLIQDLNSEIQSIWSNIEKQRRENIPTSGAVVGRVAMPAAHQKYKPWPIYITLPQPKDIVHATPKDTEDDSGILEKAKELREWLERQSI